MTNEEKSKILIGYEIDTPRNRMRMEARDEYDNLMSIAEWKDQQFKEYLEKKRDIAQKAYVGSSDEDEDYLCGRSDAIAEIINELFGE